MTALRFVTPNTALRQLRPCCIPPRKRRRLSTLAPSTSSSVGSSSPSPPYRVLLFGADTFSCATLQSLYSAHVRDGLIQELVVVTPPDTRTGRGLKVIHRPALRLFAESIQLPTISLPSTLLKGWTPPAPFLTPSPSNLLITASFGHLIPTSLLSLFHPLNTLNLHPSLLPLYRGAAPIQWAIINGEKRTGVSVQELSRGKFDQGRLMGQKTIDIPPNSDFCSLEPLLAREGGDLLVQILRNFASAQADALPQDPSLATLAPKLTKDSARAIWSSRSALDLIRLQRGIAHQFPLWTTLSTTTSTSASSPLILQVQLSDPSTSPRITPLVPAAPGTVAMDPASHSLFVHCGVGGEVAVIERIKAPGGKWVKGKDWWNGSGKTARGKEMTLRFE